MAKGSRPAGGGSLMNTARNLETASPANVEKLYNSMAEDLRKLQTENRVAKNDLYNMPRRTKAQRAAIDAAEQKLNESIRREYAIVQGLGTIQNIAVKRGIIKTTRKRVNKAFGYDYETQYTWKASGKKL